MSRPPLQHPLAALFQRAAQSLATALAPEGIRFYHGTIRNFLNFLGAQYPQVDSLEQLRRDPHILAWFTFLRAHQPPLVIITYTTHLFYLRRMLEELAWTQDLPMLARLVLRQDTPRREQYLPRPLTAEQDRLIQQELLRRDDRNSNAFLLLRHTGMRIGECADLSFDCLRLLGPQSWAIHVPLGKLKTERMVPVDAFVCHVVERLRLFRSQDPLPADGLLLARPSSRSEFLKKLRICWRDLVATVGITTRIVPHQLRHTFASEMFRAGVSLPAVMKLLGHLAPGMTLRYLQVSIPDLQREFHMARSQPRHLVPTSRLPTSITSSHSNLASLRDALLVAQHVLEMFRRTLPQGPDRCLLDRLANRLIKITAETRKLGQE
ncbi:MAG TPA: tyrosine-type recombinase/integrase [Bryobacteraceae bacterium]|jgi:site-specific recombinase XerD|nr:tyrosine-type recombinase/integrase [Bryobacteraceae bacterium]